MEQKDTSTVHPGGLQRLAITDQSELESSQLLVKRLREVPGLVHTYERTAHLSPKGTSELGDDDRRTSFLQLTHFVSAAMSMATDSLLAAKQLLQPEDGHLEHRLTAQFPLIRTSIESAATALWLVRPESQRERILRLLQLRITDINYDVQLMRAMADVIESMDSDGRSLSQRGIRQAAQRKQKHRARIDLIARNKAIGLDEYERGAPGNEEIIRQAADDGGQAASIWRLISGLTHPSPMRVLQTSKTEVQAENGDNTDSVLVSTNVGQTTIALMTAMLLYRDATDFRRARMLHPIGKERT